MGVIGGGEAPRGMLAIIIAFLLVLVLVARGVDIGLALVFGILTAGTLLPLSWTELGQPLAAQIFDPPLIQLVAAVVSISGWGNAMKINVDLERVVAALAATGPLCVLIPAVFVTLNVQGGAVMSAPFAEQSAGRLGLRRERISAINIFYRYIGYFVYPLYPSLILMSELTGLDRIMIVKNNSI